MNSEPYNNESVLSVSNTGRNDPCFCGSGQKYKKCCLTKKLDFSAQNVHSEQINQGLKKAFAGQQFESIDDAKVFADHKIQQHNDTIQAELGGFSPSQLYTLLNAPIEEQELIQWQSNLNGVDLTSSPIISIFLSIKSYLNDNKAKATARGNLPAALVKYVLADFKKLLTEQEIENGYSRINKEDDFRELSCARFIFEQAGLLRKNKGYFVFTKQAEKLSEGDVFKLLFMTYIEKYSWASEDSYPEADFFQTATWYSLVVLNRLKEKPVEKDKFAEDFMLVFPNITREFQDNHYHSATAQAMSAYSVRVVDRFWQFFGLVSLEGEMFTKGYKQSLVTSPLLSHVFTFKG